MEARAGVELSTALELELPPPGSGGQDGLGRPRADDALSPAPPLGVVGPTAAAAGSGRGPGTVMGENAKLKMSGFYARRPGTRSRAAKPSQQSGFRGPG